MFRKQSRSGFDKLSLRLYRIYFFMFILLGRGIAYRQRIPDGHWRRLRDPSSGCGCRGPADCCGRETARRRAIRFFAARRRQ